MTLSVVILNYNVRYFLELCLKSVEAAVRHIDAEIIVVDNNSSDDSTAMIHQLFPSVRLIINQDNLGFSKGNNIGIRQAKGEYICILNPDTVVGEDTFQDILSHVKNIPDLGILGCQLIDGRGVYLPESKRNVPTPLIGLQKLLGFSKGYYNSVLKVDDVGAVDILVGCFMIVKKEVFQSVGGFDEAYFMYGEDIDLSYRIKMAGYQNLYFGKTKVIHYKGESTLKNEEYAHRFYKAMQIFYKKHFQHSWLFNRMIFFGSRYSKYLVSIPKPIAQKERLFQSLSNNPKFEEALSVPNELIANIEAARPHAEIIFDGNTLPYKIIIDLMGNANISKNHTFKILPKGSQFLIGSNTSDRRGQVIPCTHH